MCVQIMSQRWSRTTGWGFTHARVHRQWVLERFSAFQCTSIPPAPKNSLPLADLLLCSTLTRSSGSDGDSDVDSELEERVDGVKSWLSKNKGSSKALSDDGSLKGSRWVQGWAWGWWAEDGLSCAGAWVVLGGFPRDVAFGAVFLSGACEDGQERINAGEQLSLHWRHTSPHPGGTPWSPFPHPIMEAYGASTAPTPSASPELAVLSFSSVQHSISPGLIPCSILPSFTASPHLSPHLSENVGRGGERAQVHPRHGAEHRAPLPFPL